jgi:hypothetical protein
MSGQLVLTDNNPFVPPRNSLLNGNMSVWAGGTSFSSFPNNTEVPVATNWALIQNPDGGTSASITVTRQPFQLGAAQPIIPPFNPKYYLQIANSTPGTSLGVNSFVALRQHIQDVRSLTDQVPVKVEFWLQSAVPLIEIGMSMQQNFGTGGSPSAPVTFGQQAFAVMDTAWRLYTAQFYIPPLLGKAEGSNGDSSVLFNLYIQAGTGVGIPSALPIALPSSNQINVFGFRVYTQTASPVENIDSLLSYRNQANTPFTDIDGLTLGDTLYGSASGVAARLAGNITNVTAILAQTGTGSISAAPSWLSLGLNVPSALAIQTNAANGLVQLNGSGYLPALNGSLLTNLPAASITGTLGVVNGGTGQTSFVAGHILTGNGTSGLTSITPGTGVASALASAVNATGGFTTFGTDMPITGGTFTGDINGNDWQIINATGQAIFDNGGISTSGTGILSVDSSGIILGDGDGDGNCSFASGQAIIDSQGGINFAGGQFTVGGSSGNGYLQGRILIDASSIQLGDNGTGAASFANGALTIDDTGLLSTNGINVQSHNITNIGSGNATFSGAVGDYSNSNVEPGLVFNGNNLNVLNLCNTNAGGYSSLTLKRYDATTSNFYQVGTFGYGNSSSFLANKLYIESSNSVGNPADFIFRMTPGTGGTIANPTIALSISGSITGCPATFSGTVNAPNFVGSLSGASTLAASESIAGQYLHTITNSNAGTGAYTELDLKNDTGDKLRLVKLSSTFTPSGNLVAGAGYISGQNSPLILDGNTSLYLSVTGTNYATLSSSGLNLTGTYTGSNGLSLTGGVLNITQSSNSLIVDNINNTSNGTGAGREVDIGNGTNKLRLITLGTGWTTSGIYVANGAYLQATGGPIWLSGSTIGFAIGSTNVGGIDASGNLSVVGNLSSTVAGKGLQLKAGRTLNTAVLVAGTVTVSDSSLAAGDQIFLGNAAVGGTLGALYVSARTNGTGFTISSMNALDTSTVAYMIVHQN